MAAVSVRGLDDEVKERLRLRAAAHGQSLEAEIRAILTAAVATPPGADLLHVLRARMSELGGVELDLPGRTGAPRAAAL